MGSGPEVPIDGPLLRAERRCLCRPRSVHHTSGVPPEAHIPPLGIHSAPGIKNRVEISGGEFLEGKPWWLKG